MEAQFALFERPDKKGISQIAPHTPPYAECEALESSYQEYLHHCKRVKAQARLPTEIIDTFQQQISSGMHSQIVLGLLYCMLTNNNPSCNYPWDYLKDLQIDLTKKSMVTSALLRLTDDFILFITAEALSQLLWVLDVLLKARWLAADTDRAVTAILVSIMRHIDVNRVTRYSLNLAQSVQKFVSNHLDWMQAMPSGERTFIHQTIYLFLRLIENHDHADLQQSRREEVRFVARLFDKFLNSWTGIGRDFIRLFQHLYPIDSFTQYWGLIDNDTSTGAPSVLVQILEAETSPRVLQICIGKQEQRDLVQLCADITNQTDVKLIMRTIEVFVSKYLTRNKLAEHSCDVIRFVMSCYNETDAAVLERHGLPDFRGKHIFLFNLLFYFFGRTWKNEVRTFIYEAMLMEVLYCRPSDTQRTTNAAVCTSCHIIDRVLQHGSTRQPDITANFLILILETVRHYKSLHKAHPMRTLPHDAVVHFFKTSPNQCHLMVRRKDFAEKYQSLVQQFKREFDALYKSKSPSVSPSPSTSPAMVTTNHKLRPRMASDPSSGHVPRTLMRLEFEDNLRSAVSIPSTPALQTQIQTQSQTQNAAVSTISAGSDFKNDVQRIRQRLTRMESEEPFKAAPFCVHIAELSRPLQDYYGVKLIELAQAQSDKGRRSLNAKLSTALKSIERVTTALLDAFVKHYEAMAPGAKRRTFAERFARGIVDVLGMDYALCFLTPDRMSPIWSCVLHWASTSKAVKGKKAAKSAKTSGFEFDFDETRVALLKWMCEYRQEVKFIVLLWDSRQPEAKGFIKHLGVAARKRKSHSAAFTKLHKLHSWSGNQVDGVKVNAHAHGLLYGRRPFESIICDLCEKDWNGSSWHCVSGCDFDTCHECFVRYLQRKQLYRAILHLRSKDTKSKSTKNGKHTKTSIRSDLLVEDIKRLQAKSSLLLSALHQYLFYSYSCLLHPRLMQVLHVVLSVINPLQVQSLCKDMQLALFSLVDPDDVASALPRHIESSLAFPQYIQLSFWTLLGAFLRTRANADVIFLATLKHLAKLKRVHLRGNGGDTAMWVTAPAMHGLLDWTQIIHKSKRVDEIYDALLSFPTNANDDSVEPSMSVEAQRSVSPSTTVFNASSSSFDEFHIQALVQLLSLRSPRWKSWLQHKFKTLRAKYAQRQLNGDEYVSLNKTRKRSREDASAQVLDTGDRGFLLNLLKFYEYLTFVEPNIRENAVSEMAATFLFDAEQRHIVVEFLSAFSALDEFLNELQDFWPPESSKSVSPKRAVVGSKVAQIIHKEREKSVADRLQELEDINAKSVKRKHAKKRSVAKVDSGSSSDEEPPMLKHPKVSSLMTKRTKMTYASKKMRSPKMVVAKNSKEPSPLDLIPKRKTLQFSASQTPSKRSRSAMQTQNDGRGGLPPIKKRKVSSGSAGLRRAVSDPQSSTSARKYSIHSAGSASSSQLKKSPRKRKRQIEDSSDDEETNAPIKRSGAVTQKAASLTPSEEMEEDDEDEEDSLANRYSASAISASKSANDDEGKAESWF